MSVGALYAASMIESTGRAPEDFGYAVAYTDDNEVLLTATRLEGAAGDVLMDAFIQFQPSSADIASLDVGGIQVTRVTSGEVPTYAWTLDDVLFQAPVVGSEEELLALVAATSLGD